MEQILDTHQNESTEKELEIELNSELQQRTRKGIRLIPAGAIILVASCISTLLLPSSHFLFEYVLYGLTSLGACVAFYGLYCLME